MQSFLNIYLHKVELYNLTRPIRLLPIYTAWMQRDASDPACPSLYKTKLKTKTMFANASTSRRIMRLYKNSHWLSSI